MGLNSGESDTIDVVTTRTSAELPTWFRDLSQPIVVSGSPDDASAVCHDSRRVEPGAVFVAISGLAADGNSFIPDAISAGARSVIVQMDAHERWQRFVNEDVTFVAVPDARTALAEAAAGFYGTSGAVARDDRRHRHRRKDDDNASHRASC